MSFPVSRSRKPFSSAYKASLTSGSTSLPISRPSLSTPSPRLTSSCTTVRSSWSPTDRSESGLWIESHLFNGQPPAPAGTQEAWLALLRESLGTKALTHITHLHIFIQRTHTFWTDILAHLPQVSHLKVIVGERTSNVHDDAQALPGAAVALQHPPSSMTVLCEALSPSPDLTTAPVPVPMLREFTVSWEEEFLPEIVAAFPRLPSMLVARARAGYPVRRVVVQALLSYPLPDSDSGAARERRSVGDLLRGCADLFVLGETEYEVVNMGHGDDDGDGDGVENLCMFVMRDVWKVEGEDEYWEENFDDRPHYDLRPWT